MKRSRAVVLRYEVGNLLGKSDFLCESHAISHMTDDDFRALVRAQVIVRVITLLVFHEVVGRRQLPNIVVQSADTSKQGISAHYTACILCQLPYRMGVLICSGRSQSELA